MNKTKRLLFWIISYTFSLTSLIISFPVVLFTFYPYSIIAIAIYAVLLIVLSVLSFSKKNRNKIFPRALFGMLLIPIITLLSVLVSIQIGWLHFPG